MVDNIHSRKRSREEAYWTAEISQELLRLRFRELQHHFDNAQTVADVHEAWGVVASTLNRKTEWGLQVNAVDCSDHFTKLRQQWEESSTIKLHVMMAECFSTRIVDTHQSIEQERTEVDTAQGMLKKSKIVTGIQQVHEVSVSSSADPVPMAQDDKAISSSQPATATSSEPSSSTARDIESFLPLLWTKIDC
ncbi:unnamed protein product [Peronospora belbahrii]|uniref:Myb/SANT-like domain-containing protein n=1 Tax=Peronospora belbahrii TaxID=622444 RepID=A0ABN8CNA0_9STRA|nr:unnamed protein product [Peronospora belbahrii]